ncbi:hypothetical protein CPB86DRAFT_700498 [Serendipita vermifera]|nr:hypothetical protein CPB86DRAFT_700498 [Serendipita vermifera]
MDSFDSEDLAVLALSLLPDIPGVVVSDSATLTWGVQGWSSTTDAVRSPHFMCGGIKWRLVCYPQGSSATTSQDSVSLYLDRGDFGRNTNLPPVCVQFCLVMSNPYSPSIYVSQNMAKRVGLNEVLCGYDAFCSRNRVTERDFGSTAAVVQSGEVDVTVFLRVMHDPDGELWMSGIPSRITTTMPSRSSPTGNEDGPVASTSASSNPPPIKNPPPCRAAYPGEECMICADEPLLFPAKPPTQLCQHEARICLTCLEGHVAERVKGKGVLAGIDCPAHECPQVMDYHEVKIWADEETFARYDRLLARQALGVDEDFVLCTNAACDAGQIHSQGADEPIVTCYVCQHRTCFIHQVEWHEGYTCEEWDQQQKIRSGIATTPEYLSKFTKLCPNCKKPIEKYEGCDALTCKPPAGCGHTFCWRCLAPYEPILRDGNHRHYTDCKYYVAYDEPRTEPAASAFASVSSLGSIPPVSAAPEPSTSHNPPTLDPLPDTNAYSPYDIGPPIPMASTSTGTSTLGRKKWYRFWKGG